MKAKIRKHLNLGLLAIATAMMACQNIVDNPDVEDFSAAGAPTITKITTVTDLNQTVTQSGMGQWLAIHGDNLAHPTAILFNDVEVNLKDVYAVRTRINVAIPAEAPNKLTNTLTVRTALGETTTNFTVDFPKLKVVGLDNEFAKPGSNVTVMGEFFNLYGLTSNQATFTLGGKPLTVVEKNDKKIVLTIPEDAADGAERRNPRNRLDRHRFMLKQTIDIDVSSVKHRIPQGQECHILSRLQECENLRLILLPCFRGLGKIRNHRKDLIDDLDVFLEIGARDLEGDAALFFLRLGRDEDVHLLDRLNRLDR